MFLNCGLFLRNSVSSGWSLTLNSCDIFLRWSLCLSSQSSRLITFFIPQLLLYKTCLQAKAQINIRLWIDLYTMTLQLLKKVAAVVRDILLLSESKQNYMQAQPGKHCIQSRLHFASKGKLKGKSVNDKLEGLQWIMDEDSLTDIIGVFKEGICESADVYSMKDYRLRKVRVKIQDNEVLMGGNFVEEQSQEVKFIGSYLGYKRQGFGKGFENYQRKDYEEWGIWNGENANGRFVREHQSGNFQEFTIIQYQSGTIKSETSFKRSKQKTIKSYFNQKGEASQEVIDQRIFSQKLQEIEKWREKLLTEQKEKENTLGSIQEYPLYCERFHSAGLSPKKKLTNDQCELYLQYLFHQQENHQNNRTTVLWQYIINCYYMIEKEPQISNSFRKELNKHMQRFAGHFLLFGGFWDQIIIPLIFPNSNHYCFAIFKFSDKSCILYDSLNNSTSLSNYQNFIKKFLLDQAVKCPTFDTKSIQNMEITLGKEFPVQFDNYSCGYYMLCGVSQLMKEGKVIFNNDSLSQVKQKIINKLNQLNDWMMNVNK